MVLFGGSDYSTGLFADTWEWDDIDWLETTGPTAPPPTHKVRFANHAGVDRLMLFSGCGDATGISGTWYYTRTSDWPDEDCMGSGDADADGLAGCADPDCDGRLCPVGRCSGGACQ